MLPVFRSFRFINGYIDLSSKDVLMRVVAQNLSPELTLVEKVSSIEYDSLFQKGVEACIHCRLTLLLHFAPGNDCTSRLCYIRHDNP